MKETIKDELFICEFEDSETAEKFCTAIAKVNAEQYVVDRMIDGVCQSLLKDIQSGSLSFVDTMGLDTDSPGNVLKVAAKFLANLVVESALNRENAWKIAHSSGLPRDDEWSFDPHTRQFSRQI